ncbi:MAG: hypothetical protein ACRBFS_21730 [Aureispira sp.]
MSAEHEIQGRNKQPARKRTAAYYVMIKFKNNATARKFWVKNITPQKMETYLKNHLHLWENAHLAHAASNTILHYYHPSQYSMGGDQHRLTKERYNACGRGQVYLLCIIPTTAYKRKTGNYKYKSGRVYSLDEVASYWNKNVLRIDIRIGKQLVNHYDEKGFRYAIQDDSSRSNTAIRG